MNLEQYRKAQSIAKRVLSELPGTITPDDTEESIAQRARGFLSQFGAPETWYHGVHALVLLGSRSCISVSGRNYSPFLEKVGETNLITVDLSPVVGGYWGDCARSFAIEHGRFTACPKIPIFKKGLSVIAKLHARVREFVQPSTTFEGLHIFANSLLNECDCQNLDFGGNFGHSIAKELNQRIYIEKGNQATLESVEFFTFEPHIRLAGTPWGFKHENIYFFDKNAKMCEL